MDYAESESWMQVAIRCTGREPSALPVLEALVRNAGRHGQITPDPALIEKTFDRSKGQVRDLRSGQLLTPRFIHTDTELWLSADTGLSVQAIERVTGCLEWELIEFWETSGPKGGKARLVLPADRPHPIEQFVASVQDQPTPRLPDPGEIPTLSPTGSGWKRSAGEYQRPEIALALISVEEAMCVDPLDRRPLDVLPAFWTRVRGLEYHRKAVRGVPRGRWIWLELVPEPNNPADFDAVAFDYNGLRVGYLGATMAEHVQTVVRYQNADGRACFAPGFFLDRDTASVVLPTHGRLGRFFDSNRIKTELLALWEALPAEVREQISNDSFDLSEDTVQAVLALRYIAPHLGLPTRASPEAMPTTWERFMAAKRDAQRRERAARRAAEREATAQRLARRRFERAQRNAQVLELDQQGLSRAEIATTLQVSSETVRRILSDAGLQAAPGMNQHSRAAQAERIERCEQALRLQELGLTRAEIAHTMTASKDTVRLLLRDGRFYREPESNEERLTLAVLAHQQGWSRSGIGRSIDRAKRSRAVADAHALEQLHPHLLV